MDNDNPIRCGEIVTVPAECWLERRSIRN